VVVARWRRRARGPGPGARLIAPKGFQLVPVADAVAATQRSRDNMAAAWADVRDVAPEDVWDPAWLVLLTDGDQQATIEDPNFCH
jgi:hypothetical protein